ncbi:endonuclease/exonuclease/phosphatase family protein [Paractinoplanes rishiriensis]|uniref:Endonuclease/exonuclease/phosphatase domain-containing protein n=1 Tax=Paractinoplanes rishiriensis TaxID=1050105 RepID=A0A919N1C6_9ACTN|nr:endonuclease/exonuclease/phosphatase family protein [Actinoplanes rishiriensis]GIF01106.1 hypothetical protein Ari01nite_85700 [Actinoplanes rishiriensis]
MTAPDLPPDPTGVPASRCELTLSLFNYQGGGLQPDGSHRLGNLIAAFAEPPVPDVIALCEAKFWHRRGRRPFCTAINQLSAALGRPYVGELFTGPLGTAIIYDPTVLRLSAGEEPEFDDKRNLARFSLRQHPDTALHVYVEHWSHHNSDQRLARARLLAQYGTSTTPTLIAGDLNSTSSGPHLPVPFWGHQPPGRLDYQYRPQPDGTWTPDTRAVDRLIGTWHDPEPAEPAVPGRRNGAGFHHLAEHDPQAARPFPPTGDNGLHIDYLLANTALLQTAQVVPGSYRVHLPDGFPPPRYSDHRRISCTLALTTDSSADQASPPA